LIVLLTIASIFLCGVVVTYVASAENFKEKYDNLYRGYQAAKRNEDNAKEQLNEAQAKMAEEKTKLNADVTALQTNVGQLEDKLAESERERSLLLQKVNNWASIVQDFKQTNDNQGQLLENTLEQQKKLNADLNKQGKQLDEATAALIEKSAIIAQLQAKLKGLTEDNAALQGKMDQYLRQYGKALALAEPVTKPREAVRVAPPVKDIDLEGSLTSVDLKNLLAEISIGSADGVKEGMRFHTTRDSKFVCDVVILEVEPEKAVGWLELVQADDKPRAGDAVRTNL
jgi:peptidoglycan hydrolase CwlO-like protein